MGVDREEKAVVPACVSEPLKSCHSSEWISAKAAVVSGYEQALNAEVTAFFPSLVVENPLAIVLDHIVVKLLAGKTTDSI